MVTRSPTRTALQNNSSHADSANNATISNMQESVPYVTSNNNNSAHVDAEVASASVKLPQFWTSCPEAWFVHVEMQFATKRITRNITRFEHVVASLPQEVIMTVLDVVQRPISSNSYEDLKQILIERHTISENRRLDRVLSDSEIGDRRPSEFFRSLSLLAGTNFSRDVLTKLWIRKLPKSLNVALTGTNVSDHDELLKLADRIWDVLHVDEIAEIRGNALVQTSANSANMEKIVENLVQATSNICESVRTLSIEISSLRRQSNDEPFRSRRVRFNQSRSPSRNRSNNRGWLCKYHYRYGDKANKCEQPCSFAETNGNSTN